MFKRVPTALWAALLTCGCLALGFYAVMAPCYWAAQRKISRQRVAEIDKALLVYLTVEKRCPATLDDLIRAHTVDRRSLKDVWGTRIAYLCSERGTQVRSAGRDRAFDTADDITSETWLPQEDRR